MATVNYRTINIDALDPESSTNFDLAALTPSVTPASTSDVQNITNQIRQLLRGGDSEGALRGALENVPYGADAQGKDLHAALVVEILQSIRQSDMTPLLTRIYQSDGGIELVDVLMKYLNKGMALSASTHGQANSHGTPTAASGGGFSQISGRTFSGDGGGQAMSVLLSWHEKVVEIAGLGSIVRCMSDRRTV